MTGSKVKARPLESYTSLQALVRGERAMLSLSVREVAARSGGLVSPSTVHAIESGKFDSVSEQTLEGLARGLSLPRATVDAADGLPGREDDLGTFRLPKKADRLTRREREHVLALVDLLLERRRG